MDLLRYYLDNGELKTITDIQVSAYLNDSSKKNDLADFIYLRHYHRYIKPFEFTSKNKITVQATGKKHDEYSLLYKNGFSIMANCCLLIETFEAFYRGWENTKNQSEKAFLKFFTRDRNFIDFSTEDIPTQFYKHIRCGILHQGETTGGWKITRDSETPIIEKTDKKINATIFIDTLHQSLKDYKDELVGANLGDERWVCAKKKIKAVIKNSQNQKNCRLGEKLF